MTREELRVHIEAGLETPGRDYKQSSECDKHAIARDILAMTNTRGGGTIIIGVAQTGAGGFVPDGVLPQHDVTYKYDDLKDTVDSFADPYVNFSLERCSDEGKNFIVIRVSDFDEHAVICRKDSPLKVDGSRELRQGELYVRTNQGRPASRRVQTSAEMRAVVDLAVDKTAQKLRARGYLPGGTEKVKTEKSADAQFKMEAKDLIEMLGL